MAEIWSDDESEWLTELNEQFAEDHKHWSEIDATDGHWYIATVLLWHKVANEELIKTRITNTALLLFCGVLALATIAALYWA